MLKEKGGSTFPYCILSYLKIFIPGKNLYPPTVPSYALVFALPSEVFTR